MGGNPATSPGFRRPAPAHCWRHSSALARAGTDPPRLASAPHAAAARRRDGLLNAESSPGERNPEDDGTSSPSGRDAGPRRRAGQPDRRLVQPGARGPPDASAVQPLRGWRYDCSGPGVIFAATAAHPLALAISADQTIIRSCIELLDAGAHGAVSRRSSAKPAACSMTRSRSRRSLTAACLRVLDRLQVQTRTSRRRSSRGHAVRALDRRRRTCDPTKTTSLPDNSRQQTLGNHTWS